MNSIQYITIEKYNNDRPPTQKIKSIKMRRSLTQPTWQSVESTLIFLCGAYVYTLSHMFHVFAYTAAGMSGRY